MRALKAATLYQQTRLNLEPASPTSTIDILVLPSASIFPSRSSPKRRRIDRDIAPFDENAFSRFCLATESDIYFRPTHRDHGKKHKHHSSTKLDGILWRVLEEQTCIELQCVALSQDEKDKGEPLLTLRLVFANKIRHGGVAFAEAADESKTDTTLILFIMTVAGELFTLNLSRDFFVRKNAISEQDLRDWCNIHKPTAFTYRAPFRLLAESEDEVWTSLSDGGLVRLQRLPADHGNSWRESFFTEGGWKASMRGLIPWKGQRTVPYGELELDLGTTTSMAMSPTKRHIWTVCIDHTLKAWDITTGKTVVNIDIATDSPRDTQKPPDYVIDPAQSNLVRIYENSKRDEYIVVVYSPKLRDLRVWAIRDEDLSSSGAMSSKIEIQPASLIEESIGTSLWTLESFHLQPPLQGSNWTLWLLIRSGTAVHLFASAFNALNSNISGLKKYNWVTADAGDNTVDVLQFSLQSPINLGPESALACSEAHPEQWLEFLFYPGRFSTQTLEAALTIYERSLPRRPQKSQVFKPHNKRPLMERISDVVGANVILSSSQTDGPSFKEFTKARDAEWEVFYGVVKDLHKRRELQLALAFDDKEGTPWLVMADQIAPVRRLSELEVLWYNREFFAQPQEIHARSPLLQSLEDASQVDLGQIFQVLEDFRASFSKPFLITFGSALRSAFLQESDMPAADQIQLLYNMSGFEGQVSEEDYEGLTDAITAMGGFEILNNSTFGRILDLLNEPQRGHRQKKQLTKYGARTLMSGARTTLEQGHNVILDLTLLIVFMAVELEAADLGQGFDPAIIFAAILEKAREYELLKWLASHTRQEKASKQLPESKTDGTTGSKEEESDVSPYSITVLESIFIGDWAHMQFPNILQSALLTYWSRAWVLGADLSQQYNGVSTYIMCNLLKNEDNRLAFGLLPFLPSTPWATYLRGRLYLAQGEHAEAANFFKQAADGLCKFADIEFSTKLTMSAIGEFDVSEHDRVKLLNVEERMHFSNGLPRYYKHISSLFESSKVMSYAADFAQLALGAMLAEVDYDSIDDDEDTAAVKADLLARLFSAALHTSRYTLAFDAIKQYKDLAFLRSALQALTTALTSTGRVPLLLDLPFPEEMVQLVDDVLVASLAKGTGSSEDWKVLYSWRIKRNNFRGAASVLWDQLQVLKNQSADDEWSSWEELSETYLMLINVLSLVGEQWAWILVMPNATIADRGSESASGKRKIVTLEQVRKDWQDELDRRAELEAGRFAFVGGEGMEVDVFAS